MFSMLTFFFYLSLSLQASGGAGGARPGEHRRTGSSAIGRNVARLFGEKIVIFGDQITKASQQAILSGVPKIATKSLF